MALSFVVEGFLYVLTDLIFEALIKGVGYIFLRYVLQVGRKKGHDPDGAIVVWTGIVLWGLVFFGIYELWRKFA